MNIYENQIKIFLFLDMFTKLQKVTVSRVVSLHPLSVHVEQLGSHRMDFHEVYIWVFLEKYVKKI